MSLSLKFDLIRLFSSVKLIDLTGTVTGSCFSLVKKGNSWRAKDLPVSTMGVINTLVKLLSSCVWLQGYFKRPVRACFQQPWGMLAEWQMEGCAELSLNLFCSTLKTQQNRYVSWLWISWDFKTLVLKPGICSAKSQSDHMASDNGWLYIGSSVLLLTDHSRESLLWLLSADPVETLNTKGYSGLINNV